MPRRAAQPPTGSNASEDRQHGGPLHGYGFVIAACAASVLVVVLLAVLPMMATVSHSIGHPGGGSTEQPVRTTQTIVQAQGWTPIAVIGGFLLLSTGVPLLAHRGLPARISRTVSAALLLIGAFLGALSVGVFVLPVAVLMVVAAVQGWTARTARPSS